MKKIFISYAHKDEKWKNRLVIQLEVLQLEGFCDIWDDRKIGVGDDWKPGIETALKEADIAILMVSADFLVSNFIRTEEVPRILERRKNQQGFLAIPVFVKPCPWQKVAWLQKFQGEPRDGKTLEERDGDGQAERILADLAGKIAERIQADDRTGVSPSPGRQVSQPGAGHLENPFTDTMAIRDGVRFVGRESELRRLKQMLRGGSVSLQGDHKMGKSSLLYLGVRPVELVTPTVHVPQIPRDGLRFSLDNPVFNVPHRPKGEGMVGREGAMEQVCRQLLSKIPTAIGHTAAFQGLGGLGKTQLAVEYATRYRKDYPGGVIWIDADFDIDNQLLKIARDARWIAPESDEALILEIATQRLKTRSDCLIIYDNVENREAIANYLPEPSAIPHLLLTSRTVQEGFTPIPLELLDSELSLKLLLKEAGRTNDTLFPQEQQAAREIAIAMDGLPLAIEIAGAYLRHVTSCSFVDYKAMMEEDHLFKQGMRGELLSSLTGHERNLYMTLRISEHELKKTPLLKEILDLLAWSGDDFMGISLMAAILNKKEADLIHALNIGKSLNILHQEKGERRHSIHRLVRRVCREEFPIAKRKEWVNDVCSRLGDWFEGKKQEFNNLPIYEAELEHLTKWLEHDSFFESAHAARLTWLQFYPHRHRGKYYEAKKVAQKALELFSKQSNPDEKIRGNLYNDIGFIFNHIGNYIEALEYNKHALAIRRKLFGENHKETARSLYNVGSVNSKMGNFTTALNYQKQALEIRKRLFGYRNAETAKSLNNIGGIFSHLGKHQDAIDYTNQALKIRLEIFEKPHPDIALSLNSIGVAYSKSGDHNEALNYKLQALEIQQKLFGENHPDTALSISNVGFTYSNLGNHALALDYSKQALEIWLKLFGENHPDTARSINNIGLAHAKLGNFSEAQTNVEWALKIRMNLLGAYHPETSESINNIIYSLADLKNFKKAETILKNYLKNLPLDHPRHDLLTQCSKYLNQKMIQSSFHPAKVDPFVKTKKHKS